LPVNHKQLTQTSIKQKRTQGNVETEAGNFVFRWSYTPLPEGDSVYIFVIDITGHKRLKALLTENELSAKMLVRRDIELVETNKHLHELLQENAMSAKMLIRRDIELTEANDRLRGLDIVKSEFVSVAAHQLRTPLTGIRWSFQALTDEEAGTLNREQKKVISDGLKATLGAINLVNDLLNVARIEGGRFGYVFRRQSLIPIIRMILPRFKKRMDQKAISFLVHIPQKLPLLNVDEERIEMVFDSVLDNSVKYTNPGGKVTLEAKESGKNIEITVSDTGIGIPETQKHRLFDKFFRASNAILFQTSGTGLGLYMAGKKYFRET